MKTSVIFGVIQMMFGIILKGMNAIYFNQPLDFIFDFIPQIIFMSILFFYLTIMIFIKWATDWSQVATGAPSLISLLMNIFLAFGSVDGHPLFPGQEDLNFTIFIVALLCIPILLLPKPIITFMNQKKAIAPAANFEEGVENEIAHDESHEESFQELFIHQVIETIEFVLGAISNTASYLRLWALSLAHAQLAKVFFEKFLLTAIHEGSIIMIVIGYFFFANATFGVLMCMDLMECCLHTLRLHWVEFQNKFYKGDGYKFTPFSFRYAVELSE
jgi:V-type H+-transporting ATPase subunit a